MKTAIATPVYSLIYTRVSSKSQKNDGSGDASQEVRCLEYSNHKGYIYEKTFEDVFTGGGNYMNRKGMVSLLRYIDENKDKQFVVIFDDLKRFARDVKFHITLREELAKRKARVESPNFHFDDSPEGEANELYTAVSNQLERKQNQRQVIQKQTARLVDGYWPFHAPKGYVMRKVEGRGKVLFPNHQAHFLKEALEGFANFKFNKRIEVVQFLQGHGVFSKQHPEKYLDTMTVILKNSIYAGYIEYPQRGIERRIGKHEGIISPQTFEAIQRRLVKAESARIRCDLRDDFPIRGFVTCAACGYKLTGAWAKGKYKKYPYYQCYKPNCLMRGKTIPKKIIEDEFAGFLKEKDFNNEIIEYAAVLFEDAWAEAHAMYGKQQEQMKEEIRGYEEEIVTLVELSTKTASQIVREQYERRIERLSKLIQDVQAKIDTKPIDYPVAYRTLLATVLNTLKNPYIVWNSWDLQTRHKMFLFFFDDKLEFVRNEGYRTPKMSLGIRVLEEIAASKTANVDLDRNTLNSFKEFVYKWHRELCPKVPLPVTQKGEVSPAKAA
ncbi:MAG: recombinase family protein [Bacteroidota bacterium]